MSVSPSGDTFVDCFRAGRNRFGTLRHVLALTVLLDHASILTGAGGILRSTNLKTSLGGASVTCFFILSGALITASWEHSPNLLDFLRNRAIRILPAYWVCLAVTVLVLGPIAWTAEHRALSDYWHTFPNPLGYLWRNGLLMQFQNRIGDLFAKHTEAHSVNGSLWSIPWEAGCYALVAVLGLLGIIRRARWVIPCLVLAVLGNNLWFAKGSVLGLLFLSERVTQLPASFLSGSAFYLFRQKIPRNTKLALIALIATLYGGMHNWPLTGAFAVPYLLFYSGTLGIGESKLISGKAIDLSYGIYIYGFPVQQCLLDLGWFNPSTIPIAFASVVVTLLLASISWILVESPCLRLKVR